MISEDKSYPCNFFRTNEITLVISGLNLPRQESNLIKKYFYYLYAFFLYTMAIVFFILEIIKLRDTVKSPTKFFSHIGLLITHVMGILKACLLLFSSKRIRKVKDLLQDERFKYEPLDDFEPAVLVRNRMKYSSRVSVLVFFLYSMAGVSAFCSAWSSIILEIKTENLKPNFTCENFLPFYFHIPFEVETKGQCENIFTFMGIALCAFAWFIECHDAMLCAILNYLKTQLDILGQALRCIRERTLNKLASPAGNEAFYDEESPELEEALYRELKRCIQHLESLLQASDDLETIFTYITLAQTLGSILIISSCLFVAITVPITSPIFFSQTEYFLCILLQLWLICSFGNDITFSSSQIIRSLYESDWFSTSLRYKKSMIMIMCRMQRPFYLSIGKFTPLTLVTFMAVCRGSFSYFAVFRSIK